MNKRAIREFAVAARKKLIEQVTQKAFEIGIGADQILPLEEVGGYLILRGQPQSKVFAQQRDQLIEEIKTKGYQQVMEEVAYLWFNRFIALRFMEVNNYLPSGIRVLSSSDPGRVEPDLIREALNVDLGLDKNVIYEYLDANDNEGLFKNLLIHQCNALNKILPFLFERLDNYTELLFPSNLLEEGSVIRELVTSIPQEDWQEVEIIGWLYQYYVSEKKDEVFAGLKKNKKITKENIPAATQLFTPKWIVQYLVENSLGRMWLESNPDSKLQSQMPYYLEPREQDEEVKKQLETLRANLEPEEITLMDPACGSGHILVYAFDVFYEIYQERGYLAREIPRLILEHNLFGLEIDDRAAQLASFALLMKARSKSQSVFEQELQLNIVSIQESNNLDLERIAGQLSKPQVKELRDFLRFYKDAKDYGSILEPNPALIEPVQKIISTLEQQGNYLFAQIQEGDLVCLRNLLAQTKLLTQKYDLVITNPPYMGNRGMNPELSKFVKKNYPLSKRDLFAIFMERSLLMTKPGKFMATINQHSWMFISTYEELRLKVLDTTFIDSMLHLGPRAFEDIGGEKVQSTAFVLRNTAVGGYRGLYSRLVDENAEGKEKAFLKKDKLYTFEQQQFGNIAGSPIAYWASDKVVSIFKESPKLESLAEVQVGLFTCNNDYFLKLWFEVDFLNLQTRAASTREAKESNRKWFPYNKGGAFRKWYGNQEYVVNFANSGAEIAAYREARGQSRSLPGSDFYFQEGITWSFVSSSNFGVRYTPKGFVFDVAGSSLFPPQKEIIYFTAFLTSKLAFSLLGCLNPTLNFQAGNVRSLPIIVDEKRKEVIDDLAKQCIEISKRDWDSFETSWNFTQHPLLGHRKGATTIKEAFANWEKHAEEQFSKLKAHEEELNQLFIEIYGLEDELTPDVPDADVTVSKADRERDIKSFISYAVGCMMGRYSLAEEGLVYAGGDFEPERYRTFLPSQDGIIPLTAGDYFADDIVERFVEFVRVTFGEATLWENLEYIADTLDKRRTEGPRECIRRYFLKDFYKDHVKTYQKRPIYWLFRSENETFNALVYLHRYDQDTVARVRTDYLHKLQDKLIAEQSGLVQLQYTDLPGGEKTKIERRLGELERELADLIKYDEEIHHLADRRLELDLDDGVATNYAKFEDVLAKM